MKPLVSAWAHVERRIGHKQARYSMVSIISVAIGQAALVVFYVVFGWSAVVANVSAVCVGAVPSYSLNRAWTWQKTGDHSLTREVLPFWIMALVGLLFSTWLVALAEDHIGTAWSINAANIAGFGILWVAKFIFLERVLFAHHHHDDAEAEPAPLG